VCAEKVAAGEGKKGALRRPNRRLSDSVYRHLVDDLQQRAQGPATRPAS